MTDRRLAGGVAVLGGALLAAGALLPWLTLFAGLQRLAGTEGPYGWVILGGGALAALVGVVMLWGRGPDARMPLGLLGAALLALCLWLLDGQREVVAQLRRTPFYVPRPGPGIVVATAGAVALTALLPWGWWSRRRRR